MDRKGLCGTKQNKTKTKPPVQKAASMPSNTFSFKGLQLYRCLPGYGTLTQPRVVPANSTTRHLIES